MSPDMETTMALTFMHTLLTIELERGNDNVRIEADIQAAVDDSAMELLESELSANLGHHVFIQRDPAEHRLYVCQVSELYAPENPQQTPITFGYVGIGHNHGGIVHVGIDHVGRLAAGHVAGHVTAENVAAGNVTAGDVTDGHVAAGKKKPPRPMNCWMLYRDSEHKALKKTHPGLSVHQISTICSSNWRRLSKADKEHWRVQAKMAKEEHERKFPNYKYNPRKPGQKKKRQSRKATRAAAAAADTATSSATSSAIVAAVAAPTITLTAVGSGSEVFDFNSFPAASIPEQLSETEYNQIAEDMAHHEGVRQHAEVFRQRRLEAEFGTPAAYMLGLQQQEQSRFRAGANEDATLPNYQEQVDDEDPL